MATNQGNIGEKAKRIEIALKFTNGDMDKAKLMASGSMSDVIVVKGKFIVGDQDISGFFLAYFNIVDEYIAAIKSVIVSNSSIFTRIRIFDEWRSHYKNILAYEKGEDKLDSEKLNSDLLDSFIKLDVFPDVQKQNLEYLSSTIPDILKTSFNSSNVKSQIDLEQTSSLELVLMGIDIMVPASEEDTPEEPQETPAAEARVLPESPFAKKLAEIESKAQFIVEGCCVLSPVKGKLIAEITPGERIYVVLPAKDSVSQRILDAYKARNSEGNPLPVIGRVMEKINNELTKGYILYVLVAKGIYAKIIEEENMKIQTELTAASQKSESEAENTIVNKYLNWALYVVFILLIIALIVIFSMI
ncbi:MAG TPA: hypothetical protein PKG60_03685 [Spirochaetota bacterium]|nr:hypothetical protein [Spirochaetota bacterium]HPS85476.1 hypothetical protein [Spirochaetota bacterium]